MQNRLQKRQYDILSGGEEDYDELFKVLTSAIEEVGFATHRFYLEKLPKGDYFKVFGKASVKIGEFYFQLGKLYFRRQVPAARYENLEISDEGSNEWLEHAFMLFYTAGTVGHKQARAYLALYYENGLVPSQQVIMEYTGSKQSYEYLRLLSDVTT